MILSGSSIRERNIINHYYPRNLNGASYDLSLSGSYVLWPKKMKLVSVIERIMMPLDLVGFVLDKSSLVRRGVTCANTMIQPGWRGHLTLELMNHGWFPVYLPASAAIAQVIFHALDRESLPYRGRYQDQEPTPQVARGPV